MLGHVLMNRKLSLVHHITKLLCTVLRHKRASSKFYTTASQALLPGTHVLQLNLENYIMYSQRANRQKSVGT